MIGAKGSDVYSSDAFKGVGDKMVALSALLTRGVSQSTVEAGVLGVVAASKEPLALEHLFVLAFQTRDIRGGKGERDASKHIFETLLKREKLGSTGIGQGIAIPHGKLPSISRVYGLFARLATPVDFDSVDGQPVDLVFVLLAPEHAGADHLKALARISRLLRDSSVVAKLRGTEDAEGLYAILTEPAANPAPSASAA